MGEAPMRTMIMTQPLTQDIFTAAGDEVVGRFQSFLRLDTRNPPGNEILAANYLRDVLARDGIDSEIVGPSPDRASIVARLRGDGDGAEEPLLLMSHTDVVAVEPDKWTQDPFGGRIVDGFVYGRGALDMKNMVAMELQTMLLLKRRLSAGGLRLKRDVIFMAAADEEVGGRAGAGWVVDNRPELIRAAYALNEGGGNVRVINGVRYYHVQTAEKGVQRFRLRARGTPGHASLQRDDNAVLTLAAKLARLRDHRLPLHLSATARAYIEGIAAAQPEPTRGRFLALLDQKQCDAALAALDIPESLKRQLHAITHNTVSATILQAGSQINVIPSVAEAQLDARIVPGQTRESFLRELKQLFGDDAEIEFLSDNGSVALEADVPGPLWRTIEQVLADRAPGSRIVPKMLAGATDAKHVARLGTQVYGFCPELYVGPDERMRVHGHDERMSVESLKWGARTLYEVVERFCT
jgi:acetylornithine deacetylase/succinyl-diaminopimelate desuccinylase-like protein